MEVLRQTEAGEAATSLPARNSLPAQSERERRRQRERERGSLWWGCKDVTGSKVLFPLKILWVSHHALKEFYLLHYKLLCSITVYLT